VGSIAHVQICGTTTCMICGAEDLIKVCKEMIAPAPHTLSADGKFSWEEVECMGACANAPMAQIGKDYYEDLTPAKLRDLIARFSKGEVPVPGPQNGRYAAEPLSGLTTLKDFESGRQQYNASAQLAVDIGDTVKRIDGTEVPILTPWLGKAATAAAPKKPAAKKPAAPKVDATPDAPAKAPRSRAKKTQDE
jgi:NADH-quinone oxidoreductase subunit E